MLTEGQISEGTRESLDAAIKVAFDDGPGMGPGSDTSDIVRLCLEMYLLQLQDVAQDKSPDNHWSISAYIAEALKEFSKILLIDQ